MATVYLDDIDLKNNKIENSVLQDARLSETIEEAVPGKLQLIDGVPHYINANNVATPIHENAIREISDPDGIITAVVENHKATIAIAPADGSKPGLITAEQYALLSGAKTAETGAYGDDLVLRTADGNIIGYRLIAQEHVVAEEDVRAGSNIVAGNLIQGAHFQAVDPSGNLPTTRLQPGRVVGLQDPPPDDGTDTGRDTYAARVGFVESAIESAIATANSNLQAVPPLDIDLTEEGNTVFSVAPATEITPGTLSAEHYALLAGATSEYSQETLVKRDPSGNVTVNTLYTEYQVVAYGSVRTEGDLSALGNIVGGNIIQAGRTFQVADYTGTNGETIVAPSMNKDGVSNLPLPPTDGRDISSYAVNVDLLESSIETAIASANANLQAIAGTAPIVATPTGDSLTISINPATETTPGTLSAEHFALLDGAGSLAENSLVKLDRLGDLNIGRAELRAAVLYGDVSGQEVDARLVVRTPEVRGLSATPATDSSATSVAYVRNAIQNALRDAIAGMDRKSQGVRLAFDTNVPLATSLGTYQGVDLQPNDSILLFSQANPAENGAYYFDGGDLVRRPDSNSTTNLTTGASYQVEAGTFANHVFTLVTQNGFVLDTDPLTFLDISGVNVLRSGDGISVINQTINAKTTIDRTVINAEGNLDISPAYDAAIDQKISTAITPLQDEAEVSALIATAIAPLQDATEVNTLIQTAIAPLQDEAEVNNLISNALYQNKTVREVINTFGNGVSTSFTMVHGLSTFFPSVAGYYEGKPLGAVDYTVVSPNAIQISASLGGIPIATNSLTIVVQAANQQAES